MNKRAASGLRAKGRGEIQYKIRAPRWLFPMVRSYQIRITLADQGLEVAGERKISRLDSHGKAGDLLDPGDHECRR